MPSSCSLTCVFFLCCQTGLVKRSHDTFVIHPLPAHLARHVTSDEGATPHLVYKRSEQQHGTHHTAEKEARKQRSLQELKLSLIVTWLWVILVGARSKRSVRTTLEPVHKCINGHCPQFSFNNCYTLNRSVRKRYTRRSNSLHLPNVRRDFRAKYGYPTLSWSQD